jgi:hypothetical protein
VVNPFGEWEALKCKMLTSCDTALLLVASVLGNGSTTEGAFAVIQGLFLKC